VGVEVRAFLSPMQRHMGGIDVQYQLLRRLAVAGNELIEQHPMQGRRVFAGGRCLQPAQRGRRGQFLGAAHGRLQRQVPAQRVVVRDVFPAAAQPVHALCQQAVNAVAHACCAATIGKHPGRRSRQADALVGLTQQHHAAVADDVPTVKGRLHHPATHLADQHRRIRTLWHWQPSPQQASLLASDTSNNALGIRAADRSLAKYPG